MENLLAVALIGMFINSCVLLVVAYVLVRHSRSLERARIERMQLRARMNSFMEKGNPIRARVNPLKTTKPAEVEFDFSIFDLDDTL